MSATVHALKVRIAHVIDTTRSEGTVPTRNEVSIDVLATIHLTPVVASHAIKYAHSVGLGEWSSVCNYTAHLQSFVGCSERKALAWVRIGGLTWGHVEEPRVKEPLQSKSAFYEPRWQTTQPYRLIDEASMANLARVSCLACGIKMCIYIESVGRDLAMNIQAWKKHALPQLICRSCRWKATGVADDLVVGRGMLAIYVVFTSVGGFRG